MPDDGSHCNPNASTISITHCEPLGGTHCITDGVAFSIRDALPDLQELFAKRFFDEEKGGDE